MFLTLSLNMQGVSHNSVTNLEMLMVITVRNMEFSNSTKQMYEPAKTPYYSGNWLNICMYFRNRRIDGASSISHQ